MLIIPHTLQVTTFGALRKGDDVNLEIDMMARYAARLMERAIGPLFAARALATTRLNKGSLRPWPKKTSAKARKSATALRMLIVEARFYERHFRRAAGAAPQRVLDEAGAQYDRITVPGALEIPAGDRHCGRCRAEASARPMTAWSRSAA